MSDVAGTTRDAVDVPFTIGEGPTARHYVLVDTAGMKKHTQMSKTSVDNFALFRSEKAIEEADVVLLVLESELGPTSSCASGWMCIPSPPSTGAAWRRS